MKVVYAYVYFKWCAGDSSCFGLAGTVFEVTLIGSSMVKFNKAHLLDALQPFLGHLLNMLLSFRFDPSKRMSAKAALEHHYFRFKIINFFKQKNIGKCQSFLQNRNNSISCAATSTRTRCLPSLDSLNFLSEQISSALMDIYS